MRAIDAIDIHDIGFDDAISGGVTTVIVKPGSGNPIGGLTVPMKTWGATTVAQLGRDVSLKSALGENPKTAHDGSLPKTRMGIASVIRQAFLDARHYAQQRDQAREAGNPFKVDLDLETLTRVLDRELIWDVHAHRHDDIATALRLADEFDLRLIVNHGTEGHRLTDVLAERGIPVVFGPFGARTKIELREFSIHNVVVLAEAGIELALISDHPEEAVGMLSVQAAMTVREGLHPDLAFGAITSVPAKLYGLDDRVGTLAPGLDGDVVVWSGHPLDAESRPDIVVVGGRVAYRRG